MGTLRTKDAPTQGLQTYVYCGLLPVGNRTDLVASTLKAQAAIATATTITVATTTSAIPAGQWLAFKNPTTGVESLAKLTSAAAIGATTLTVAALEVAIAVNSTAQFPPEFTGRDNAGAAETYNVEKFSSFNTGGFEDGVFTGGSASIDLSGLFFEFDPVFRTIVDQSQLGREFEVTVQYPAPSTAYSKGRKRIFKVLFNKKDMPTAVKGFVQMNVSATVLAFPVDTPATI